jgi:FkbM family methyltransferase
VYEKKGLVIKKGETWLDGGANIGAFSLLALVRGASVVAFEPHPENCDVWKKNILANFPSAINDKRVVLQASAISASSMDSVVLHITPNNHWRHTVVPENLPKLKSLWTSITVTNTSLAKLLTTWPDITAIKLDIEGAELAILETGILASDACKNINKFVFEYHFDRCREYSRKRYNDICEHLKTIFLYVAADKVALTDPITNSETYDHHPYCKIITCHTRKEKAANNSTKV